MTADGEVEVVRAEVEALKAAKLRLMALVEAMKAKNMGVAEYRKYRAGLLEEGRGSIAPYATWSKEQFSEPKEYRHPVLAGHGREKLYRRGRKSKV
jgi:hypothetical protein